MIVRLWNAYTVELTKAAHRKFTYAGPALAMLTALCMPLVHPMARDGVSDYSSIAYVTPMALNLLGFMLLLMYCAALVSSEIGNGSICLSLLRPLRRHEFILAKILLGMTYAVVLTASVTATAWLVAWALGDLEGVAYGGEIVYTGGEMFTAYLFGALLALLPQWAAVAYAVMISSFTRSTGAAIGSAVGVWLMADVVKHPLHVTPFVFSSYLEIPWKVFIDRCDGLDASWFPDTAYLIAACVPSILVFALIAMIGLSRRDLRA
jgi:hypothetical protein